MYVNIVFSTQVNNDSDPVLAVVLSERIFDKVKTCEIRSDIYGASDHCPIIMEIDQSVLESVNSASEVAPAESS